MSDITWGPEIAVNGKRPAWLADNEQAVRFTDGNAWYGEDSSWYAGELAGMADLTAIRLPADHFAYVAIDKSFEPWGGGDAAPEDWDGGEVLLRNGLVCQLPSNASWQRGYEGDPAKWPEMDVLGYQTRTVIVEQPSSTVTIARMTEAEVIKKVETVLNPLGWADTIGVAHRVGARELARVLGLLREETVAERFTRETGHPVTPAVEAALTWGREQ